MKLFGKKNADEGRTYIAPTSRGYKRPGAGYAAHIESAPEWRGTSRQVCGLWPFAAGSGSPLAGVPLGTNQLTGNVVGIDPITAFKRGIIANPSCYFMSLPALGKSSVVGKMMLGMNAHGVIPMTLGDVKGEHVARTLAMGGQSIPLGNGRGFLNPLDPGASAKAAARLTGTLREEVLEEAHSHRQAILESLITVSRSTPPTEGEVSVLDQALRILFDRFDGVPLIKDLVDVIASRPQELSAIVLDRGDENRYLDATDELRRSLGGLVSGGRLGTMFSRHTTEEMDFTRPSVFDLSGIGDTLPAQQAAGLLASWSAGFAGVKIAQILADAGLEPRRNYVVVLDEFWRALRVGRGIVDRADSLTRLNRHEGIGQLMVSHTLRDFDTVENEADRKKAQSFAERSGMIIMGGLPKSEMESVARIREMTNAERARIVSWGDSKKITSNSTGEAVPYGRGKFLVKLGNAPGIPITTRMTEIEKRLGNTNLRWDMAEQRVAS
ncbi:ATP/GTP-binding protein [Plantibacter sp. RU18]|uniref:ATP/GTP-binding protein n=1 Tax=Plantibacter sp. RU18 TaxID=3158143 RepID=UPI003D36F2B5